MKKALHYTLLAFVFLIGYTSCGDDNKDDPREYHLSQKEIIFPISGGEVTLDIDTRAEWTISKLPEWCTVDKSEGKGSGQIKFTTQKNEEPTDREQVIEITFHFNEKLTVPFSIKQLGEPGNRDMTFNRLALSVIADHSDKYENGMYNYTFKVQGLFTESKDVNKIFLGSLLYSNLEERTKIKFLENVTYEGIMASTTLGGPSTSVKPAGALTHREYANHLIKNVLKPGSTAASFTSIPGRLYTSYRQLNLLGMAELGINLEHYLNNKTYLEQEMKNKTGLIYAYNLTRFDMQIDDIPEQLIAETLTEAEHPNLSYVSTISYGQAGFLIVESDASESDLRTVVACLKEGEALTAEQEKIASELSAYHNVFDKEGKPYIKSRNKAAIADYFNTDNIMKEPVILTKYEISNFFDHGVQFITFPVNIKD